MIEYHKLNFCPFCKKRIAMVVFVLQHNTKSRVRDNGKEQTRKSSKERKKKKSPVMIEGGKSSVNGNEFLVQENSEGGFCITA